MLYCALNAYFLGVEYTFLVSSSPRCACFSCFHVVCALAAEVKTGERSCLNYFPLFRLLEMCLSDAAPARAVLSVLAMQSFRCCNQPEELFCSVCAVPVLKPLPCNHCSVVPGSSGFASLAVLQSISRLVLSLSDLHPSADAA